MDVHIDQLNVQVDRVVSDVPGLDEKAVRRIVESILAALRQAGDINGRRLRDQRITVDLDTLDQPADQLARQVARQVAAAIMSRLI